MASALTIEEFINAAKEFVLKSDKIGDGWCIKENNRDVNKTYLIKESYSQYKDDNNCTLLKVEYIIFFHTSYGVPTFSFNIWDSSGTLVSLENIRKMSSIEISQKDFYSVITQQEHPIFQRPYFIVHPCHTDALLTTLKHKSKNIIVTFLSLITPIISLNLSMNYGLK